MSLDVDLMVIQPTSVYHRNITHNLGKMAAQIKVKMDLTLYDVLWRPDEHGFTHARDIVDYLHTGWKELLRSPEEYKAYNPENGWGEYDGLCNFVYQYRNACWENPDAELRISR